MSSFRTDLIIFTLVCGPFLPVHGGTPSIHRGSQEPIWKIRVASFETETKGNLEIEVNATCLKEDGRLFQPTIMAGLHGQWLHGWKVHSQTEHGLAAKVGTFHTISFFLRFDPDNLPYTYRRLQIGLRDEAGQVVEKVSAYIYFTPYGTSEVWNSNDFQALNRRWDSMHQPPAKRHLWDRTKLSKKDAGLLKTAGPGIASLVQAKPKKIRSFPGLAYAIPVADQPKGASQHHKMDFAGTVEGQVVVNINGSNMNIADIAVEAWQLDSLAGDNLLATGFTGDDGRFSINFQGGSGLFPEMEVYLTVASYNQSDSIRVRTRLNAIRSETFFKTDPATFEEGVEESHDFGVLQADTNLAKPQLLHWANRARQFVEAKIPGVLPDGPGERLDIMPAFTDQTVGFFIPGGYKLKLGLVSVLVFAQFSPLAPMIIAVGSLLISSHDGLYIGEDRETEDNTTFHEFGHYLMWHLQGESWIDIFQASFANHSPTANNSNPKITLTEGFATGFANIVDTWSQADDGEFGGDNIGDYEARAGFDGTPVESVNALTHGFFSEWNVGCALYDLWDGPSQALQDGSFLTDPKDYDDSGTDQIERSFADLVLPLQNHAGTGGFHNQIPVLVNDQEQYLLTDIVEYHGALMDVVSPDCQAMRQITDLLNEDSVNNFAPTSFLDGDLLSSDRLAFDRVVPVGTGTSSFSVDVVQMLSENDEYNLSNFESVPNSITLSDDLLVSGDPIRGSATLFFNGARTVGWQSPANIYAQPWFPGIPPGNTLDVDLCGYMTLEVREGGKLVVGEPDVPPATVILTSGSTLILGGDDNGTVLAEEDTYNTFVSMGTLEINPGSRFVVEAGATLIYNRGGNIVLNGDTSVLEVYGDIIVSEMANFKPTGDGEVIFGLPDLGGSPNVTVHNLSVIQFLELRIRLIANTYFRPDDNVSVKFLMEHGIAGLGTNSYIHTGVGPLVMDLMDYASTDAGFHQGIWINNINHSITQITMAGGAPGLWGQTTVVPLVVSASHVNSCDTGILGESAGVFFDHGTISNCVLGIDTVDGIVTVQNSELFGNHQAIHTNRGGGTLSEVIIQDGDIGWRAEDPATDMEVLSSTFSNHAEFGIHVNSFSAELFLSDVLMEFNQVGLRTEGSMDVIVNCSQFIDNVESGLTMADGARLDMGNSATNTIQGSDVNLTLEDAGLLILDGGHNQWTTAEIGDFNILGSLAFGTCTCTNGVDGMGNPICGDPWYFSNIPSTLSFLQNSFTTPGISQGIEILDAATMECTYLPLTSAAGLNCPIIP